MPSLLQYESKALPSSWLPGGLLMSSTCRYMLCLSLYVIQSSPQHATTALRMPQRTDNLPSAFRLGPKRAGASSRKPPALQGCALGAQHWLQCHGMHTLYLAGNHRPLTRHSSAVSILSLADPRFGFHPARQIPHPFQSNSAPGMDQKRQDKTILLKSSWLISRLAQPLK